MGYIASEMENMTVPVCHSPGKTGCRWPWQDSWSCLIYGFCFEFAGFQRIYGWGNV